MSHRQLIANTMGTCLCSVVMAIALAYVPYEMLAHEPRHLATSGGELFSCLGFAIMVGGTMGVLTCYWKFIFVAKGSPIHGDSQHLIVCGLYRCVRNPMYISVFLILLGEALFFRSMALFYYFIGAMVLFHIIVVFIEEPFLNVRFGESYDLYCRSVRRWIPRIFRPWPSTDQQS